MAVLFILQRNSRQRARQFHAHDAMNMLKMLEHWARTPGLKRSSRKGLAHAQALVALHQRKLPAGVDVKKHWSGLGSIENVAKKLGYERMYATLYRYTSASAHATDFGAHVDALTNREELLFNLSPTPESVDRLAVTTREMFWLLANRLDQRFQLGFEIRLLVHKVTRDDFS